MLASAVDDTHLMTLVGLSLLPRYGIVVASEYDARGGRTTLYL
jgi:hypothetical protein